MTPENENFDQLRKLLALKRHEVPPPGYFNNFSARVIARIEVQQADAAQPWWNRFFANFGARPALACAYSVGVGCLVIVGLSVAIQDDSPLAADGHLTSPALLVVQPLTSPTSPTMTAGILQPATTGARPSAIDAMLAPDRAPTDLFPTNGFRPATQVNLQLLLGQ